MHPDKILDIGNGPVKGMKRFHSRLYICCGIEVVVVEVGKDMTVAKKWRALDKYVMYCMRSNWEIGVANSEDNPIVLTLHNIIAMLDISENFLQDLVPPKSRSKSKNGTLGF